MLNSTHTYATLEVSAEAFDEIKKLLHEAKYDHAFDGACIDMHGIGLVRGTPASADCADLKRQRDAAFAALTTVGSIATQQEVIEVTQDALAERQQDMPSVTALIAPSENARLEEPRR